MAIRRIRSSECRRIAASLRESLGLLGVTPPGGSDIGLMLAEMDWLGGFPPDSPQPEAAHAQDAERALAAFPLLEQSRRIAGALERCKAVDGLEGIARWFRKKLNRLQTQEGRAQDHLLELEVAGRLVNAGEHVSFAEPDLVWHMLELGMNFSIACKRPRTEKRIPERLKHAGGQIERAGRPGVIVIGVEAIIQGVSEGQGRVHTFRCDRPEDLAAWADARVTEIARRAVASAPRIWTPKVRGVEFLALVTGLAKQPSSFVWSWSRHQVRRPDGENGPVGPNYAELLDALLFKESSSNG